MLKKILVLMFAFWMSAAVAADHAKPLVVILDWFVNPDHAPLFVAEQEGFFKAEGIEVTFVTPSEVSAGDKLVASGHADIAITYQPSLMYQVTQGLPVVRFATLVNTPLDCLVVLKSSGIQSIAGLKGKLVGYSDPTLNVMMLNTMLKHNGLTMNDVKSINVNYDLSQALLSGKIDAFTGGMRNFEPSQIALEGQPVRTFYPEDNGFPSYEELIFITNKNELNDPRLPKFVAALQSGVAYLVKHPESSWEKFAVNHPELNNELNKKAWFASIRYFDLRPGVLNKKGYQSFAEFMKEQGAIPYVPELSAYAVQLGGIGSD